MPKEEREKKSILYWKTGLLCTFSALHRSNQETQRIKTIFLVPGALEQSSKIKKKAVCRLPGVQENCLPQPYFKEGEIYKLFYATSNPFCKAEGREA